MTNEEYKDYVNNEKGPLLESLSSVKEFEVVKITGATMGEVPYRYVDILHLKNPEELYQKDALSQKFQDFLGKNGRQRYQTSTSSPRKKSINLKLTKNH